MWRAAYWLLKLPYGRNIWHFHSHFPGHRKSHGREIQSSCFPWRGGNRVYPSIFLNCSVEQNIFDSAFSLCIKYTISRETTKKPHKLRRANTKFKLLGDVWYSSYSRSRCCVFWSDSKTKFINFLSFIHPIYIDGNTLSQLKKGKLEIQKRATAERLGASWSLKILQHRHFESLPNSVQALFLQCIFN